MQNANKKNVLLGVCSNPDRNMNIDELVKKSKEIDCRHTVFIDKADIVPNPENEKHFPQTNIEELKEWIYFRKKLYHDLIVVPIDGTRQYMLVDGERRYRAILSLDSKQYSEVFPMGINCSVFPASTDSTLLKLDSTLANYLQRHTDVFLRRQEILDLYECLIDLKKREIVNCDIISHMSDTLGIKEKQLKNYINTARLIPEFEKMLQEGSITLREAIRFSTLDSDSQMYLYKKYSDDKSVSSSDFIEAREMNRIRKAEKKLEEITESLEDKKEAYEKEHEELCLLSEKSKNKEKIKRQEKREFNARQKLIKEEKRYKDAFEAFSDLKKQIRDEVQKDDYNAESVLTSIITCLEKIEMNPNLILHDEGLKTSLMNIRDRFIQIINKYENT